MRLQLYTPWNFHERAPGKFTFEGFADVERFLDIAQDLGLNVLLRVGPYICGEWDFGGFPWWLASSKAGCCHVPHACTSSSASSCHKLVAAYHRLLPSAPHTSPYDVMLQNTRTLRFDAFTALGMLLPCAACFAQALSCSRPPSSL